MKVICTKSYARYNFWWNHDFFKELLTSITIMPIVFEWHDQHIGQEAKMHKGYMFNDNNKYNAHYWNGNTRQGFFGSILAGQF